MGDKEEKQSLKSWIISFIFSSLCSLALPVGLSFYFAPEKSFAYFQDTLQDKVDTVRALEFEHIYDLGVNIAQEIPPMLKTEYDVFLLIAESATPALQSTLYLILLDYRVTLGLLAGVVIAAFVFPFQEAKDWIINVVWGSVCVVAGFLPLDSGMDVLADKEAGVYRMTVMICAVITTLIANYLVVIVGWWVVGKFMSVLWGFVSSKILRRGKSANITKSLEKED